MSTQKHTASPWIISDRADTQSEYHTLYNCAVMPVAKSDYDYVGSICDIQSCDHINGISYGEAQANARLIAAAPELLEALKISRGNVASLNAAHPAIWGEWLKVINAAISKAEAAQ
jgi:hypothetical protein